MKINAFSMETQRQTVVVKVEIQVPSEILCLKNTLIANVRIYNFLLVVICQPTHYVFKLTHRLEI